MFDPTDFDAALDAANRRSREWLRSIPDRPVRPSVTADELLPVFDFPLPDDPTDAAAVVDRLAADAEPGLMAMDSGRFFGWVIGGSLPAALGADWLVSTWGQNAGMRDATPAVAVIEEAAGHWLVDLLHLPPASEVGFTTGATMANFAGLAAGRADVLTRSGWDVNERGLNGAPPVRVFAGAEVHASVILALRYLGLGAPTYVAADDQGRMIPDALEQALAAGEGPALVVLQVGNLHSGSFDPVGALSEIAHRHGAWVHVDGAFGLWAAVSPRYAEETVGWDAADSWATDAHKTLNVPYDCGVSIVARPGATQAALAPGHTDYLFQSAVTPDPHMLVPDFSRRARGVPVWAALRELGRSGTIAMVEGMVDNAKALAEALEAIGGVEVINDVVFTQVCLSFGTDERTREVTKRLIEEGVIWMSGSRWSGRDVLRISVSNWATDAADVQFSVDAVKRAMSTAEAPA
jgi:glutamate/tyrosine decarboxylase-like PLP-dependent enzyme